MNIPQEDQEEQEEQKGKRRMTIRWEWEGRSGKESNKGRREGLRREGSGKDRKGGEDEGSKEGIVRGDRGGGRGWWI